ncbi:hypothetical protein [Streptomyces mirabilis]|uniref:hypothetical protein n=1 Tax=Streptomyces mirabilis TaxID=68239 RepID=UPI0033F0AD0A
MSDNVSNLPKRYQRYVQTETPQPPAPLVPAPHGYDVALPADTETAVQPHHEYGGDVTPRYRMPLAQAPLTGPVETYDERDPVVWVDDAYGRSVPMRKSMAPLPVQPTPPRDLSPQPLLVFDPKAQRIAASGVCAAGVGWGAGQFVSAAAGAGTGVLFWIIFGAVLLRSAPAALGRTVERHEHNSYVTNNNRWWGRSKTTTNHQS